MGATYDGLLASIRGSISGRRYRTAIQQAQQAIALDANRPQAYALMGFAYIYGLGDVYRGGRAYRDAYNRGGTITFYLKHDLFDGMFAQFRTCTLSVSRDLILSFIGAN